MNRRVILYIAVTTLLICAGFVSSFSITVSNAQLNPTEQQMTVAAVVNGYFTQTAQSVSQAFATQTVQFALNAAQTETSAPSLTQAASTAQMLTVTVDFQLTMDAAFQQAVLATARAEATPILVENAASLKVITFLQGRSSGRIIESGYSIDGTRIASVSENHLAFVWDVATGTLQYSLVIPTEITLNSETRAAFNPSLELLAIKNGRNADIFDLRSGNFLFAIPHQGTVSDLVFSPNGTTLLTTENNFPTGAVYIWDITTGNLLNSIQVSGAAGIIAISQDGKEVAFGVTSQGIELWEIGNNNEFTQQKLKLPERHISAGVIDLAFSPDGSKLAIADFVGGANIIDTSTGDQFALLGQGVMGSLDFTKDGNILAVTDRNGTLLLWDIVTGKQLAELEQQGGKLSFSPDGKQLAAGRGDGILLFGINDNS